MNAIPFPQPQFALVIAAQPEYSARIPEPERKWREFLGNLERNGRITERIKTIHENVWLIPLHSDMPFLMRLFDWGNGMGIPLRILFLDDEPKWIKYPASETEKT